MNVVIFSSEETETVSHNYVYFILLQRVSAFVARPSGTLINAQRKIVYGPIDWYFFLVQLRFQLNRKQVLYRGADKSLARPGRKQATATKLLQTTKKKKIRTLSVEPGLRVERKVATFQLFFFSRVGLRTYQHPCVSRQ